MFRVHVKRRLIGVVFHIAQFENTERAMRECCSGGKCVLINLIVKYAKCSQISTLDVRRVTENTTSVYKVSAFPYLTLIYRVVFTLHVYNIYTVRNYFFFKTHIFLKTRLYFFYIIHSVFIGAKRKVITISLPIIVKCSPIKYPIYQLYQVPLHLRPNVLHDLLHLVFS